MVLLWGETPNGKTHVHYYLLGKLSIGLGGKLLTSIKPSHRENYTVHILEGVAPSMRSDRMEVDKLKRQILRAYGESDQGDPLELNTNFTKLLLALDNARIVPCLAMDSIELLPEKAFGLYKSLSEFHHGGKHLGVASLLTGNFSTNKMPKNFWPHVYDIQVGKPAPGQVREFVFHIAPETAHLFSENAIKRLETCASTREMYNAIMRSVEYFQRHSREDELDANIVRAVMDELEVKKRKLAA